uniref:CUB domain-containing protein n=1 Tax=Panagrolaimus davidi TaxID=227884 RepID=A0A914QD33_9BILA
MLNLKSGLLVTNSTDLILNERSARLNFPYYNSDKYLQIDLLKNEETLFNEMEFQAYISVVKTNFDKIDGNCSSGFNDDGVLTWSNRNVYENNIQCIFELIIKPNTEVNIDSRNADLELNVDYIVYYTNENENDINLLSYGGDSFNFITIKGYENGSDKHVFFEYLTCKCAPTNIICDDFFNPMGTVDSAYVCANLTCVFIPTRSKIYDIMI